jgi:iron-sulfur cluster repair protein YtfE (RIC family)
MYVMHHAFRRDLAAFAAAVRNTPVGYAEVWTALARRWDFFAEVLHHHHQIEDDHIWPVLVARAAAEQRLEDVATLEAMEGEHEVIDPSLAACGAGFTAMTQQPSADQRNALDVHVTALHEALTAHLAHEERGALPLVQRTMTAAEWATSEAAARRAYGLRMMPTLLPWCLAGLPDAVVPAVQAEVGAANIVAARLFMPRFARRDRLAFRYA